MKKILLILLAIILSTIILGCSKNADNTQNETKEKTTTKNTVKEKKTKKEKATTEKKVDDSIESRESKAENQETNSNVSSETTLEDIEKFMLDNGAVSGKRTKMAAEMVGGIDGFKYADSGVEIYEYDVNSKEYISLSNGEEIPLQGMDGFTISATSINGKFVLIGDLPQKTIDIFNSFQ